MEKYRNESYWKKYNPDLYKTIVIVYKDIEVLEYIERYKKNIDYICNPNEIKMLEKYEAIMNIPLEKIKELPITYNIVVDEINESNNNMLQELKNMKFKIYCYTDGILERLDYLEQKIEKNILKYTNRISIELSNLCNYSRQHLKCPLNSTSVEKKILSLKVIEGILKEISDYNFAGIISFHTYNEPLIDPRLFYIIDMTKKYCPKAEVFILSNGFYFNQNIANELVDIGVDRIDITAYSLKEFEELKKINVKIPYSVFPAFKITDLDDRKDIYNKINISEKINKPCYNILNDMIITCNGKIDLCCFDWKRKYCFGDLEKQTIKQIIVETELYKSFIELAKGVRKKEICQNCINSKTKPILDFNFNGITYKSNIGGN